MIIRVCDQLVYNIYIFLMGTLTVIIAVSLSRFFKQLVKTLLKNHLKTKSYRISHLPVMFIGNQINLETLFKHMGCCYAQAHFSATAHSVVP